MALGTGLSRNFFGRLWVRLLAATVLPVLVTVVSVALLANFVTIGQFGEFMQQDVAQRDARLQTELVRFYRASNSWAGVGGDVDRMAALIGERIVVTDASGKVVADSSGQLTGQQASKSWRRATALQLSGQPVGTIYINPTLPGRASSIKIEAFLDGVNRSLIVGCAVAVIVGIALTVLFSNRLRGELNALIRLTRQIGRGHLELRVPSPQRGDLGELGSAINHMAENLQQLLQARQQMVADVAHELRNPLQNINGYIEALRDGVLPADTQTLEILSTETAVLRRLVDDLQDLSLAESGSLPLDLQHVLLAESIGSLLASTRPRAEEAGVELGATVDEELAVTADPRRVRQILANLVTNALHHTPRGGRVWLDCLLAGSDVEIRVLDTGPGIAEEDQPRIFERFYRVDPARSRATGGAGLGLTIALELARAMHGDLGVRSTPGHGAQFWVRLPGAPAAARKPRQRRRPPALTPAAKTA